MSNYYFGDFHFACNEMEMRLVLAKLFMVFIYFVPSKLSNNSDRLLDNIRISKFQSKLLDLFLKAA